MRAGRIAALVAAVAVTAAGCGGDNPAGPGNDPGPAAGLSLESFQAAELVIGQVDFTSDLSNAGGARANAVGLNEPSSCGDGLLYLPDPYNNRVLGYAGFPEADGAAAAFALGQADLTGDQSTTSDHGLSYPNDCVVDGGRLFVADTSNRRVLIWNSLPQGNVPADVVVGQPDFTTSDRTTTRTGLATPYRIAVGNGRLFVADNGNHRVMIWNAIPTTNGVPADVVLGQPDFTSGTLGLSASRLTSPEGLWTDGTRLAVGDLGNQRVLIWNTIPTTNGAPADLVLGEPDFDTKDAGEVGAKSIWCPTGIASDGRSLFVADCNLNRVLVFTPFPTQSFAAATVVLGQGDFTHAERNDSNQDFQSDPLPTSRTLSGPSDVRVLGDRLVVADTFNHRILTYAGGAR